MTPRLDRRGFLVSAGAAGAAALTGCRASSDSAVPPSPSARPTRPARPSSAAPSSGPPTAADWRRLARHVKGSLATPGSATYDTVRLVQNPRYDRARPLAVLSVAGSDDIATALSFAQDHAIPVAIRSGGHSYPGWSAGDGALVIDVRPLRDITFRGTTLTVGAGAALVDVYAAAAGRGRGVSAGSCPTVGIAGLAQGGGVGVVSRAYGLACDRVEAMGVVLADGRRVTADPGREPDLYWALRGGGGGHLGVVTSFQLSTFAAPAVTRVYLAWPLTTADQVVPAWLATSSQADRRLWSTLKLLGGAKRATGPVLFASATWTGPRAGLDRALQPFLSQVPTPSTDTRQTAGFLDTMLAFAGCASVPLQQCHTGPGGALLRQPFAATSHVVITTDVDVDALLGRVQAAQDSGLEEAGISLDSLGGAVDDLGPAETAFGHRGALATVQYTATYNSGPSAAATGYVRGSRRAMTPSWGSGAYVNYADASIENYRQAYFGRNAARLVHVRREYDPGRFFTQPQDF